MELLDELLGLEGDALTARLAELNGEQLAEIQTAISERAKAIEDDSPDSVAALVQLADMNDAAHAAQETYEAAMAQAAEDGKAARARLAGETAEPGDEDDPDGGEDNPEDDEPKADAETDPAQVALPASGKPKPGRIRRMAAATGKAKPSPEGGSGPDREPASLIASAGMRESGFASEGGRIESAEQLAEGMTEILNGMDRNGAPRGKVMIASARWTYPEDRRLSPNDLSHNERIFQKVIGKRPFLSLPEEALVASGGICSPVDVDWSVPGWSTPDRPLRAALPSFQTQRGGLTYVPPADIGTYSGATSVWTEATDANPAGATKPVVQVVCGSPTTVYVNAIPTRLGFGNLTARFAPEQTAAAIELAMSQAARTAENELLQLIAASCVADVTSALLLGTTRDFITVIDQVVAGYRSLHRIPRSVKFTAIFPDWLKENIRIDLAREIGHAQSDYFDALQISDQYIDDMLSIHGVNAVWHIDGQSAAQLSGAGGVAQIFPAQSASGAVNKFPTKVVWYIFPEGTFQFLDAGRLDLGVVRDSTLDATNDYETFVEPFEGLAFRGFSSGALQMVTTTGAIGGTAGTISTTGSPA